MLSERQLRFFLISSLEMLRAHDAKLNSIMVEVAAVRDALNEIGPRYNEVLARHRKRNEEEVQLSIDGQLQRFDQLIDQLKAS